MSGLELWLKSTTANSIFLTLPATDAKTLKDYLHGQLSPKQAANEFFKNLDPQFGFNPYELAGIAYEVPDPVGQIKLVKLLVAVRNLIYHKEEGRGSKREMNLRNDTDLSHVLGGFATTLADDQDSLWCDVLAPLRGGGFNEPDSNYVWINLNAFLARLASVNVCTVGLRRVGYICDSFIQDNDVREDALSFNTSVSAAAQYMIYSADKVFEFFEQEPTPLLRHLGWKKCKEGFKEAQTNSLIDASVKKFAKLAVAGMKEAEVGSWDRHQMLRSFDQANHQVLCSEGIQTERGPQCAFKRSHDEAFSDSSGVREES